jgi:hypothetical protein
MQSRPLKPDWRNDGDGTAGNRDRQRESGNQHKRRGHTVMLDPEGNEFCVLDRAANP